MFSLCATRCASLRAQSTRVAVSRLPRTSLSGFRRGFHSNGNIPRHHVLLWASLFGLSGAAVYFQNAVYLDAEDPVTSDEVVVDPDTSIEFPKTLRIPSKTVLPPFSLIGVGVRTVSFLKVKVYSVAFYADLTNPNLKIPLSATPAEKIEYLVRNTACVIRIVPTRNTSYTHLRDAFIRSLYARERLLHSRGSLDNDTVIAIQSPINKLKTLFPNTPLTKGTPLDILLTPPFPDKPRTLVLRDLGIVQNDWVAREFFLAYFEGDGNSPALKKSVVEKLASYGTE